MTTTTEASTVSTTAFIRDDARLTVAQHAGAEEYIAVHVMEADYWERLTLYLTQRQAVALYRRLRETLTDAGVVAR